MCFCQLKTFKLVSKTVINVLFASTFDKIYILTFMFYTKISFESLLSICLNLNRIKSRHFLQFQNQLEGLKLTKDRYDSQHNENQHNDTQHNDTQHTDTQHNDTQHNDKKCDT